VTVATAKRKQLRVKNLGDRSGRSSGKFTPMPHNTWFDVYLGSIIVHGRAIPWLLHLSLVLHLPASSCIIISLLLRYILRSLNPVSSSHLENTIPYRRSLSEQPLFNVTGIILNTHLSTRARRVRHTLKQPSHRQANS
jgi:hypothetical protein